MGGRILLEDAQVPAMLAGVENMAGELKQEGERPPDPRDAHPGLCWVSPAHSVPPVASPQGPNPVTGVEPRAPCAQGGVWGAV